VPAETVVVVLGRIDKRRIARFLKQFLEGRAASSIHAMRCADCIEFSLAQVAQRVCDRAWLKRQPVWRSNNQGLPAHLR